MVPEACLRCLHVFPCLKVGGVVLYVGLYPLYYPKVGGVVLYVVLYQLYYAKVGGGGAICRSLPAILC